MLSFLSEPLETLALQINDRIASRTCRIIL